MIEGILLEDGLDPRPNERGHGEREKPDEGQGGDRPHRRDRTQPGPGPKDQ